MTSTAIGCAWKGRNAALALGCALAICAADFGIVLLRYGWEHRSSLVVAALLGVAFLAARSPEGAATFGLRIRPRDGLRWWAVRLAVLTAVVVPALVVVTVLLARLGWLDAPVVQQPGLLVPFLFPALVVAPLHEEVLYRLVLCPPAAALLGPRAAIVLDGVIFAALHVAYGVASPENAIGGFVLSWVYLRSESILLALLVHVGANALFFALQVVAGQLL